MNGVPVYDESTNPSNGWRAPEPAPRCSCEDPLLAECCDLHNPPAEVKVERVPDTGRGSWAVTIDGRPVSFHKYRGTAERAADAQRRIG